MVGWLDGKSEGEEALGRGCQGKNSGGATLAIIGIMIIGTGHTYYPPGGFNVGPP